MENELELSELELSKEDIEHWNSLSKDEKKYYIELTKSIRVALKRGTVVFFFARVTYDLSPRQAIGTLQLEKYRIPIPTKKKKRIAGLVRYYDLGRRDWRSFYVANVFEWRSVEFDPFIDVAFD